MLNPTFLGIFSGYTFWGVIWLVIVIYSLYRVWTSNSSDGAKIVWTIVILLFNVVGTILWLLFGNSDRR